MITFITKIQCVQLDDTQLRSWMGRNRTYYLFTSMKHLYWEKNGYWDSNQPFSKSLGGGGLL